MNNIKILLVKSDRTREYGFISYDLNVKINNKINLENYIAAYSFEMENSEMNLEKIYEMFQNCSCNVPNDYKDRSLSVGDIIQVNEAMYYVDSFGFKAI